MTTLWPSAIALLVGSVLGAGVTVYATRDTIARVAKEEAAKAVEKADQECEATLFAMHDQFEKSAAEDCAAKVVSEVTQEAVRCGLRRTVEIPIGQSFMVFCHGGGEAVAMSKDSVSSVRCFHPPVMMDAERKKIGATR